MKWIVGIALLSALILVTGCVEVPPTPTPAPTPAPTPVPEVLELPEPEIGNETLTEVPDFEIDEDIDLGSII
jgi:hypothetical protein